MSETPHTCRQEDRVEVLLQKESPPPHTAEQSRSEAEKIKKLCGDTSSGKLSELAP